MGNTGSIHLFTMENPESVRILRDASERLRLSAEECVLRQRSLSSVPERALPSYVFWTKALDTYLPWAQRAHDDFVAISEGTPFVKEKAQHLFSQKELHREDADREDRKLLKRLGMNVNDLEEIVDQASKSTGWEPDASS